MSNTTVIELNADLNKADDNPPIFNVSDAIKLRIKHNYSFQMLADHYKLKRTTIYQRLRSFSNILDNPENLISYNDIRKDLLTSAEIVLLQKIVNKQTLKGASLNNAAYAFDKINHARLLEEGKPTEINDNRSLTLQLEAMVSDMEKVLGNKLNIVDKECKEPL